MQGFSTTVDRSELLRVVKKNRDAHRGAFEKALAVYKKAVLLELEVWLRRARKGVKIHAYTKLTVPQDHTSDYDRVVKMIEMHREAKFILDEQTFSQYVLDEWEWKRAFDSSVMSNRTYSNSLKGR